MAETDTPRNKNFDGGNPELSHEDYDVEGIKVRLTQRPGGGTTINVYDKTGHAVALTVVAEKAEVWDYWGWGAG